MTLLAAAACLALAGCGDPVADKAAIDSRLPSGCKIHDVGDYLEIHVLVVTCEGRTTTSTNTSWSTMVGKIIEHKQALMVQVDQ